MPTAEQIRRAEELKRLLEGGVIEPTSPAEPEIRESDVEFAARIQRAEIEERRRREAREIEEESGLAAKAKAAARGVAKTAVELPTFLLRGAELLPSFGAPSPFPEESAANIIREKGHELRAQIGLTEERPPEEVPLSERLIELGAESATAAAPFGLGLVAKGRRLAPLAPEARPGFLARKGREIAAGAAARPGRFAVGEAAAAAGEAGGRVLAQERFPESGTAEFFLGATGAISPGVGSDAARALGRKLQRIGAVARPSSAGAQQLARQNIVTDIQEESINVQRAAANIEEAERIAQEIPGFDPSAAQRARDPGLLGIERAQAAESRALRDELIRRQSQSNEAVLQEVRSRAPIGDVEDARAFATARAAQLDNELSADVEAAVQNVKRRTETATGGLKPEIATEQALQIISDESGRVFKGLSADLDAQDILALESGETATRKILDDAIGNLTTGRGEASKAGKALPDDLLEVWKRISNDLVQEGDELVSVPKDPLIFEVRDFEKELNRRIRAIEGSVDRSQNFKLPALYDLQAASRQTMQDFIKVSPRSEIARGYRTILDRYKRASDKYRRFVSGEAISRQTNPMVEDATLSEYLVRGPKGKKRMEAFNTTTEDLPEAQHLMRNYIVGTAIDQSMDKNGVINASSLERFKRAHRAALLGAPEAANEIDNVVRLQRTADDAIGRQKRSLAEFQRSRLALFVENPKRAVSSVINAGGPQEQRRAARELMGQMEGDADAVAGLRRAFWDQLTHQSIGEKQLPTGDVSSFLNPIKLHRQINRYRPAVEEIFGREHLDNLDLFSGAAIIASGKGGAGDLSNVKQLSRIQKLLKGATFRAIYSRFYSERVRALRVGLNLARVLRNLSGMEQVALLDEALASPSLLREMLLADSPRNQERLARRLRGTLITLGYRVEEEEER